MQAANATRVKIAEIDRRIRHDKKRRRELACVLDDMLSGAKRSKKTTVGTRKKTIRVPSD